MVEKNNNFRTRSYGKTSILSPKKKFCPVYKMCTIVRVLYRNDATGVGFGHFPPFPDLPYDFPLEKPRVKIRIRKSKSRRPAVDLLPADIGH